MSKEQLFSQIDKYQDEDLNFAALVLWKKLISEDLSEYEKFRYADALRLCGHYSESLLIFAQINPELVPSKYKYLLYLNLGSLYMDMGQNDNAKNELKKCLAFKESDTVPYVYYAVLLMREGNNQESINVLEQALSKKGDLDEVYYNLASNYAIIGNFPMALECVTKCLNIDEDYFNGNVLKKDILIAIEMSNKNFKPDSV